MYGKLKPKNILLITPNFYPEPFPISLAAKLINKNHNVTIVTTLPSYKKNGYYKGYSILGPYFETYKGCKVIRIPCIPRFSNSNFAIFLFYLNYFFSFFLFTIYVIFFLRKKYSIVFTYDLSPVFTSLFGIILKKFIGIHHISWIQDIWPEGIITSIRINKKNFLLKLVRKFQILLWKYPTALIAQSEPLANFLKKKKFNKNVFTIHNPERYSQKIKKKIKAKNYVFSYFGNIGGAQNLDSFLNLFNSINKFNFQLNLFGDGKMLEKYKNKYKNKNIIWHGWINEINLKKHYEMTDFFILPLKALDYQKYILPGKFTTYISKFKPIIGFSKKNGAIYYYIQKYKLGYFFDDSETIKNKIKKINRIYNQKNCNLFYANTQILYKKKFTPYIIRKKFEDLINKF